MEGGMSVARIWVGLLALSLCGGCAEVLRATADQLDPLGAEIRRRDALEEKENAAAIERERRRAEKAREEGRGDENTAWVGDVRGHKFPEMQKQLEEAQRRQQEVESEEAVPVLTRSYADCIKAVRERNPEGMESLRRLGQANPERSLCQEEWYLEEQAREAARIRGTKDYEVLYALKTAMLREPRWNGEFADVWVRACLVTSPEVQQVVLEDYELQNRWRAAQDRGEVSGDDVELVELFLHGYFDPQLIGDYLLRQMNESGRYYMPNGGIQGRRRFLRLEQHLFDAGRLAEVKQAADKSLRNRSQSGTYDSLRKEASSVWPKKVREQNERGESARKVLVQ